MRKLTKSLALTMTMAMGAGAQAANIKDVTIDQIRNAAADACEGGKTYQVAYSHSVSEVAIVKQVRRFADERATQLGGVTTLTPLPSLSPRWTEVTRIFADNGIKVVTEQDAADQTNGQRLAETVLQQHLDLDIIIGLADDATVGVLRAIRLAGADPDKLFVGGQDGSFEGLSAVNEGGAYRASAAILINQLGANIVDLALNAVRNVEPSFAYTPTVLASKAYQPKLDKLLSNNVD